MDTLSTNPYTVLCGGAVGDGKHRSAADAIAMPDVTLNTVISVMNEVNLKLFTNASIPQDLHSHDAGNIDNNDSGVSATRENESVMSPAWCQGHNGVNEDEVGIGGQGIEANITRQEKDSKKFVPFTVSHLVFDTVEATCKYSNYLEQQEKEMIKWKSSDVSIPEDVSYSLNTFPALSGEELEKLNKFRPSSLHEASKIQGITPHAIVYIHNSLTRGHYYKRLKNGSSKVEFEL
jgi:hypothetical protein